MKKYVVTVDDGKVSFFKYGSKCKILHREDGPAVEYANGHKVWYLNGKRHREDGPAIEHQSGYKSWWLNGQLHRKDGPAVEYANGDKCWYLDGQEYSEKEFLKLTRKGYCEGKEVMIEGKKYRLSQD